jgi:hypothetical protein
MTRHFPIGYLFISSLGEFLLNLDFKFAGFQKTVHIGLDSSFEFAGSFAY